MKQIILTIVLALISQKQIYCQIKNYNDKGKVKIIAEKTSLSVSSVLTKLTEGDVEVAVLPAIAGAAAVLPPVIDFAINSAKASVKKNALSYKGEYMCSISADKFYESYNYALLPKLTVKRNIKTIDGTDKNAAEIELVPELSADKTAFRYFIKDKLIYNHSIAKTKGKYDYIDLHIELKFKSMFVDKNEYKINELRTTIITVPMIHVGDTTELTDKVYSGWIPLPPRSTRKNPQTVPLIEDKTIVKTNNAGVKDSSSELTTIKKSDAEHYEKLMNNSGLYEIEVRVSETNPYKIKAENLETIVESHSETSTSLLKAIIKVLTEDEDKKEE